MDERAEGVGRWAGVGERVGRRGGAWGTLPHAVLIQEYTARCSKFNTIHNNLQHIHKHPGFRTSQVAFRKPIQTAA